MDRLQKAVDALWAAETTLALLRNYVSYPPHLESSIVDTAAKVRAALVAVDERRVFLKSLSERRRLMYGCGGTDPDVSNHIQRLIAEWEREHGGERLLHAATDFDRRFGDIPPGGT
jgi:hypothetical protein